MHTEKQQSKQGFLGDIVSFFVKIIMSCIVVLIFVGDTLQLAMSALLQIPFNILYILREGALWVVKQISGVYDFIAQKIDATIEKYIYGYKRVKLKSKIKQSVQKHKKDQVRHASQLAWAGYFERLTSQIKFFTFGIATACLIILVHNGYTFVISLPNPKLIGNVNFPVSTQIYDRNGKLLYDVFRDQDRTPVKVSKLPDHVIHATLAIEDRNFYNHNGISFIGGILRAMKDTYTNGELQGGSTITQQLVKSSLLTPERTFERKIREAILALWTERIYNKSEILEMYLNQVAYGGTAYGIEEAAKTFFNKQAKDLTIDEGALLAGLTRAPSSYSPYVDPLAATRRRNDVLRSMYETGYLSKEQLDTELKKPLTVEPPKTYIRAPHFVFYVKSLLEQKYGIRRVEEGGLRVVTTLDVDMQDEVELLLKEELEKISNLNVSNGAVLVTAPSTGEILAMVGSKDYFEDAYGAYNVTTTLRQPGSSIKPLLYAQALESGAYTAATTLLDTPVVYTSPGAPVYRPVNYDGSYHGSVPLRYALANSYNIPAVRILNELGVPNFIQHARSMGITSWNSPERYGLSLALGGAEVKMTDMAVAYGVFANYGSRTDLNPILSVEDYRGERLETFEPQITPGVLSEETSFIISDILSDNFARRLSFGVQSDLNLDGRRVAVKTGTTNSKRDNWTVGYNRKFLVGVWVGNNDNSPMNPILSSGVTGASPIWKRVMLAVLDKNIDVHADIQPPTEFSVPLGIVSKPCYFNQIEYFKVGTENEACRSKILNSTPTPGGIDPNTTQ